jgi:hypothetical protein
LSFLFFLSFLVLTGCQKNSGDVTGEVEIYLLDAYETENGGCAIQLQTVTLQQKPLVGYSDLLNYNSKEYYFRITASAGETIREMPHSVFGTAFAVTADKEVIYTGYFIPSFSSCICQCTVIDPLMTTSGKMHVNLGYPGPIEDVVIPDHRNDTRILEIFRRDGRLEE